ncbi:DUF3037 domain-containing protein [Sphingobacterium daejeonense]|uniref:DUF3037 domain-containing protein n=1 Tax=Sphingobacterium daejeonense TaxID=371142 RepID=UPI0010C4DB1E|nr:DUF3037 domain-containing protein [Sphingobacterium daejeonense]VTQ04152.1 Protein of uncharacterised function (DUF3037) [Sphingobacterium daejeonense]
MHDRTLYEYAVVRLVPRVEREEFVNIGVLLYCRKQRYADILYHIDQERCSLLSPEIDFEQILVIWIRSNKYAWALRLAEPWLN